MFTDLSPTHILILVVVAIVVVGPKDLPRMLRKAGQFMGKMRGMANEFRSSFDEMARQSELEDLRKEVEAMRKASQAALPQDLGIAAQLQSDSEAAYLANWEASHAAPTDTALSEPSILPPAAEPAPAKAPKARAASKKTVKTEAVAEPAPKPRATPKPRKAPAKKPEADA